MISKVSLGTVQFGMDYGIANSSGQITLKECSSILSEASRIGIKNIDTATVYGKSEHILGEIGVNKFNVTTKIPYVPPETKDLIEHVEKLILESLSKIGLKSFYCVLIHDSKQLSNKDSQEKIFNALKKVKARGLVKKIGVSIYDPIELNNINYLSKYDIVQAPFNILDRRIIKDGWLDKLKKNKISLQVRSIFLQGLLLMPSELRPKKFSKWNGLWEAWDSWLIDSKLTPLEACLNFPLTIDNIDSIVVGVDSKEHLQQIGKYLNNKNITYPSFLQSNDLDLIDPNHWNNL